MEALMNRLKSVDRDAVKRLTIYAWVLLTVWAAWSLPVKTSGNVIVIGALVMMAVRLVLR